ncbi:MAG: hypothetical protein ACLVKO_00690 [Dysgonomonas sp.]
MINRNGVQKVWVESNNGGAGYEKVIKKKMRAMTEPFYQGNKESRIVTNSAMVSQHIIMPFGWENPVQGGLRPHYNLLQLRCQQHARRPGRWVNRNIRKGNSGRQFAAIRTRQPGC